MWAGFHVCVHNSVILLRRLRLAERMFVHAHHPNTRTTHLRTCENHAFVCLCRNGLSLQYTMRAQFCGGGDELNALSLRIIPIPPDRSETATNVLSMMFWSNLKRSHTTTYSHNLTHTHSHSSELEPAWCRFRLSKLIYAEWVARVLGKD